MKKTPMQMIYASNEEWQALCNGSEAYSDLAPAYLSVAVVREDNLRREIVNLKEQKKAVLDFANKNLANLENLMQSIFNDELLSNNPEMIEIKNLIKNSKEKLKELNKE